MKPMLLLIPALMMAAGCSRDEGGSPPPAPAPQAQLGAFGLDLGAGKPSVKPGQDFFAHASGTWYDTFEIPPDRSSYGAFAVLAEQTEQRVRTLIEQAASGEPAEGTAEQRVGDYYAAFMDEAGIEARGLEPIAADLERIQSAKSRQDVAALFGAPGYQTIIGLSIYSDLKQPDRYALYLGQAGLGLPDREYYLGDDPKLAEHRQQYQALIEQVLGLAEVADAKARAQRIMAFETELARVHWPIERRRDAEANYNPKTKAELIKYAPGFDWQAFLDASEVGGRENFVVRTPTAVRDAARLFQRTPLNTLQDYLTFHHLRNHASYLPKRFDDAVFAFYGQQLRGQQVQRERWKRAVGATNGALGELVGQVYVAEYFPPESKAKMEALVANLRQALQERLTTLEWMGDETRERAQEKLSTFVTKIGYPQTWKDYAGVDVRADDPVGNARRASIWEWQRDVARLDSPVDRNEWMMNAHEVNAYYNPPQNEIVFPAGILQPPFFDPNADDAVNYGGIGAVIGHEIGHGFDDQGRKFAADGSLNDWWTQEDAAAFTAKTQMLVDQYSGFEALAGLNVNGANTLGENIGDLGGLNMAYHAYRNSLGGKEAAVLEGLTGDQRFFLSWAQVWRAKIRDEALRAQVLSDVHAPAYFRVNGPVRNMDEWYAAFDVQAEDALYLPPEQRVKIW